MTEPVEHPSIVKSTGGQWLSCRAVPPDFGGPTDVPYEPVGEAAFTQDGLIGIEKIAQRHADKIAVDDGSTRLTYAELLDRVYGLAACLNETTNPADVVVAIVRNSAASPVIILACTLMGRTLVPIDANFPLDRQISVFAEAGAQTVILESNVEVDCSFVPDTIPRIVFDPKRHSGAPRVRGNYDPDAPSLVIFTSGSTGRPKGVAISGDASRVAMRDIVDTFHLNPNDVVLGIASLSTGAGARDALAALNAGATIRIIDVKAAGIQTALRVLAQDGITIMGFIPSILRNVMQIPGVERAFRTLRILDLYGERVLASDIALFRSKLPSTCHICATLASTEAGKVFSWFVRDELLEGPIAPVGYLVRSKQVAIVDEQGNLVAPGEIGELIVRGPIALGLWRAGRMTRGPFLADPENTGSRIYAMGDLARIRPDGLAECVGRRDRQTKIRGLWVDLGEVEAAIRTVESVTDAAVICRNRENDTDRLVAFVAVANLDAKPSKQLIRQTVAAETAEHMSPAEIYFVSDLPRLANFKPDLVRLDALAAEMATIHATTPDRR